jgi:hypothetical protein
MPVLTNQRHERFAQELAKGSAISEAYVSAGYKPSPGSATRLSRKVKDRIKELTQDGANKTVVTIASLIAETEEARQLAMSTEQPAAAVAALTAKAKLSGLWVERAISENTNVNYAVGDKPATADEWEQEHSTH